MTLDALASLVFVQASGNILIIFRTGMAFRVRHNAFRNAAVIAGRVLNAAFVDDANDL